MFKTLFLLQLRSIFYSMFNARAGRSAPNKKRSPVKLVGIVILAVYLIGVMFFFFGMMFSQFAAPLVNGGLSYVYFVLAGLIAFLLMFIGSVFVAQKQLYESNDNELLLSMPIPPSYIVLTRLLSIYIIDFAYGLFVSLPSIIVYGMCAGLTVKTVLIFTVSLFALPALAAVFSAIFGWLLMLLTAGSKRKNIINTILMLSLFFGYMAFYGNITKVLSVLSTRGYDIANTLKIAFPPLYYYGTAIGNGSVLSLLLLLVFTLVPAFLVTYIISHSFIKLATKKVSSGNYRYVSKKLKRSGKKSAMLGKEAKRLFSSPNYLMNSGLGSVFTVILTVLLAVKGESFISPEKFGLSPADGAALMTDAFPVIYALAITLSVLMNNTAAPSLSLEGASYGILRSMPLSYSDIIVPKITLNFLWGAVPSLLAFIVALVRFDFSAVNYLYIFFLPLAAQLAVAMWCMFANIMFPKFEWVNEVTVIKQSAATLLGMLGGIGVFGLAVMMLLFLTKSATDIMNVIPLAAPVAAIAYTVMSLVMTVLLATLGKKKFERI